MGFTALRWILILISLDTYRTQGRKCGGRAPPSTQPSSVVLKSSWSFSPPTSSQVCSPQRHLCPTPTLPYQVTYLWPSTHKGGSLPKREGKIGVSVSSARTFFCLGKRNYSNGLAIERQENLPLIVEAAFFRGLVRTQRCTLKICLWWGCTRAHNLVTSGARRRDMTCNAAGWSDKDDE